MTHKLNPYLTFGGDAREAMEFYQSVFGGALTLQSFKEAGIAQTPDQEHLIMHGELITDDGMTLMGSDDPELVSSPASVALSGDDQEVLTAYWDKLSKDATIIAPFETASWGDTFGMLTDQFGTRWMVNVVLPKA